MARIERQRPIGILMFGDSVDSKLVSYYCWLAAGNVRACPAHRVNCLKCSVAARKSLDVVSGKRCAAVRALIVIEVTKGVSMCS